MLSSSPVTSSSFPLYSRSILSREVEVKITELNDLFEENAAEVTVDDFESLLHQHVVQKIKKSVEGKCVEDGYVKKDSVHLLSLSCGVCNANKMKYTASYECLICLPVEGMQIRCVVVSNSTGGVRAVIKGEEETPIVAFVSRDLPCEKDLSEYQEGNTFVAEVYGVKYELNDTFISVLALPI
jgi:hypothetical protein